MTKNNQKKSIFWMLARLTLVFMLAQIILVYLQNDVLLNNSAVKSFIKSQAINSSPVIWGWVGLIGSQLLLYFSFIILLWWMTRGTATFLKLTWETARLLGLILFFFAIVFVFFANQYFYPNSFFSFLPHALNAKYVPFVTGHILRLILFICGSMLAISILMAILGTLVWFFKHPAIIASMLAVFIALSVYEFYYFENQPQPKNSAIKKSTQPNIILIGIDSLRPSALTHFGSKTTYAPNVDAFLNTATNFMHSLTPLARTSPAWGSILTGDYPKATNMRFNLTNPAELTLRETLPAILKRNGYYTAFSTDDREFNQIDYQFGFDKIIGPKMGFNDFLLSQINDFPLSNLVMNFPFSRHLFPYNYANRASIATYYPETYNKELASAIKKFPRDKSLFLAVHFTLPHWPFYYAKLIKQNDDSQEQLYYQSIGPADQQFGELMKTLKSQGLLDNALVIFLSDHGNAFGDPDDRITQKENYLPSGMEPPFKYYTDNLAYGHGTDVLSLTQYHTVLAAKYFNAQKQFVGDKKSVVSLIDIAPTILDFLKIKKTNDMQGKSLLTLINTPNEFTLPRSIFIEAGFALPSILSATPKAEEVLSQGISYYQVLPKSGYVTINPVYAPLIIKGKNRAIVSSPWMLAFYPNEDRAGTLVLVNLNTKQWTTDMHSDFARQSPLIALATRLKRFYGDEIIMPDISQ